MNTRFPSGKRSILPALALSLVLLLSASGAEAGDSHHEIIFLIDQSGSMSRYHGPENSWAPNDRLGHRREVVLLAYDTIRDLLNRKRDAQAEFTVRIIEFGRGAVVRDPIPLRYDPATPGLLAQGRSVLKRQLKLPPPIDADTDTRAGLEAVVQLLGSHPPERTHVVLITDGKPYVEKNGGNAASRPSYQLDLQKLAAATHRQASFDVLGIIGSEGRPQYWPEWGPFWDHVSGNRAQGFRWAKDLSPRVREMVHQWLGLPPSIEKIPYYCPPYLESVILTVHKARLGEGVEVRDARGRRIREGLPGIRIEREKTYDRISVEDPPPGLWELQGLAHQVAVTPIYRRIRRLDPRSSVNVSMPVSFRYQVEPVGGRPFRELPRYPVTAVLEIAGLSDPPSRLSLVHEGEGTFATTQDFEFDQPGTATLRFAATSQVEDKTVVVFEVSSELMVTAKDLLILDAGGSLPPNVPLRFGRTWLRPAIRIRPYGIEGAETVPADVSPQPDELLEFRLVESDGVPLDGGSTWRHLTISEQGTLGGRARLGMPFFSWEYFLRRPRELFFELRVDDNALDDAYVVRELVREGEDAPELDRARALPGLLSNPLAVALVARESWWSYLAGILGLLSSGLLAAALLFYALSFVGYFLADRLRRKSVTVVVHPAGGSDLDGVRKNLTGRGGRRFKGGAVGITLGKVLDNPIWKPGWLKIRRLFRPWSHRTLVSLRYPVPAGDKTRTCTTILSEGEPPRRLRGMDDAEAYLEVRRRGKPTSEALYA